MNCFLIVAKDMSTNFVRCDGTLPSSEDKWSVERHGFSLPCILCVKDGYLFDNSNGMLRKWDATTHFKVTLNHGNKHTSYFIQCLGGKITDIVPLFNEKFP